MTKLIKNRRLANILLFLSIIGPGIITANADNDAGGITTYAYVGAAYQYKLLWGIFLITFSLAIVQEMCARMGVVTGKGLSDLIRENFGVRMTLFAMTTLLIANIFTTIAEFAGIAASLQIIRIEPFFSNGIPPFVSVPVMAVLIWLLVIKGSYKMVEKAFLLLSLIFIAYIFSGFLAKPDWGHVFRDMFIPSFSLEGKNLLADRNYIMLFIGMIGTTITPWMQFFLQSTIVDKGLKLKHYIYEKWDVFIGAFITDFVAFFIVVSTAATLFTSGKRTIEFASDAAVALRPVAGDYAYLLFAAGLFGASVLAACVLPLSTSYAICEAFGWESGIDNKFSEAPIFFSIYTGLIFIGAAVAMIPGINLVNIMLFSQVVNGILVPVILVFMLKLVNNRQLMGNYTNSRTFNIIAWITVIFVIVLTVVLTLSTFIG